MKLIIEHKEIVHLLAGIHNCQPDDISFMKKCSEGDYTCYECFDYVVLPHKPKAYPCKSLEHVRQNAVALLGLTGHPEFMINETVRKEDIKELDAIASEIFEFCKQEQEDKEGE